MHLDRLPRKGYHYYRVAKTRRDPDGVVRKQTVLYLGRLDEAPPAKLREWEERLRGLNDPRPLRQFRALLESMGRAPNLVRLEDLTVERAMDYGPVMAQHRIFEELGVVNIIRRHSPKGGGLDLGTLTEILAIHRNCDPGSRRAAARWFPTTALPLVLDLPVKRVTERKLQRALTYFTEERCVAIGNEVYRAIKATYGIETVRLDIDLTSLYFEGEGCVLARLGYNRDGERTKKQVVIAFVIDQEGFLVMHKVFPGDRPDVKTLKRIMLFLRKAYEITDLMVVADRGVVSEENLAYLDRFRQHYLLALKLNLREKDVVDEAFASGVWTEFEPGTRVCEVLRRENGRGKKYVVSVKEDRRREEAESRERRIAAAEEQLRRLREGKGRAMVASRAERERRIGAILRKHGALRFLKVHGEKRGFGFRVERDREAIAGEARYDGVAVFVTTRTEMKAAEVLLAYRERDEIEKAIQTMKSFIELHPAYVRRKDSLLGHVMVCGLAYQVRTALRHKMREAGIEVSVQDALETLDRLKVVELRVDAPGIQVVRRLTRADGQVQALVDLFGVPKTAPGGGI